MFNSRIASGVIINQALELENYDPNLLAFTYGLVLPVNSTFQLTIRFNFRAFYSDADTGERDAELVFSDLQLEHFYLLIVDLPLQGTINLNTSIVSDFKATSLSPIDGVVNANLSYIFDSTLLSSFDGQIELQITPLLSIRSISSVTNGVITKNIKLILSIQDTKTTTAFVSLSIEPFIKLFLAETIFSTITLILPIQSNLSAYTGYRRNRNSILINITNFSVSECSLEGILVNLDRLYLFNEDGISVEEGLSNVTASFEVENLDPRRAGRWTDIYFIGNGDFEVLVNEYECKRSGVLKDFTHRYKLPLGLRDRQFSFSISGQVEYIDLVKIDKVKGNWQ